MKKIILIALLLALPLVCFGQDASTEATPKLPPEAEGFDWSDITAHSAASGIDRLLDEQERYVNKYERLLTVANSSEEFIPIIEQFEKEDTAWQEKYREEINKSGHTWSKEKWLEISNRIQKNLNRITAVAQSKPFKTCPRAR